MNHLYLYHDPMVIYCWKKEIERCSHKNSIEIEAGKLFYHCSRHRAGEVKGKKGSWLWDDHWYSTDVANTENSTNNWLSNNLSELSLIQVESFRPLVFLDMSDVDFEKMCALARKMYGENVVGSGDMPIRKFMKPTVRHFCKNENYHGYVGKELDDFFIFDYFWNLIPLNIPSPDPK